MYFIIVCITEAKFLTISSYNSKSRNQAPAPKSTCQKGDVTHVPYSEYIVMELPFDLTVISSFLLGARKLVYIFLQGNNNFTNNIKFHHTLNFVAKESRNLGFAHP